MWRGRNWEARLSNLTGIVAIDPPNNVDLDKYCWKCYKNKRALLTVHRDEMYLSIYCVECSNAVVKEIVIPVS